ncbi:MAG TPA: MATE family efflux transporter [Candidatus Acutalibacter ornithocaccae]|uniref:Multidrug export protein MepA n=1 Tax=Candidatus Acutalibacter ornithocaccae TaxID=2838416 RepID=A0A9D2LZZ6_9FIRM|nr:MATE family efflux transporter [Candidatus Acutalibacter ornithocaccae]
MANTQTNDFSKGSVAGNILRLALPMTVAQLINVLYSVVDRMYIGRLPDAAGNALTGLGLTFPILSIVTAFANLFGMGGSPLFSIQRGKGDRDRAQVILGNTFALLVGTGVALTVVLLVLKRPLLYAFGASDATYPYADGYLTIYLLGSVFVMISLGMNQFINAQGFGRTGMLTVLIGAVTNILLDPVFIFVLGMGVQGAALATILSQFLSAVWAVSFLRGKKALIRLEWGSMRLQPKLVWQIVSLGFSSFVMAITNSIVQVACNSTLQSFGGDLYVGVMTIINSVREVVSTPINGVTSAAQPVMGFNYGAQEYRRVRSGIVFTTIVCIVYTTAVWLLLLLFPRFFIGLFTGEEALREAAVPSMHIYFFGFFMMSLQMAGQSAAVALGRSKQAVFFSLFRKVIIVTPLTLLLPHLFGLGVNGVFLAEPISNFIGGGACYITMLLTIWREMNRREKAKLSGEAPQ